MGGSRRPRVCRDPKPGSTPTRIESLDLTDDYFITVRDGELKDAQAALKSWAKDVTVLHSTLSQTMLFLGRLLVGCRDFNLLWLNGLYKPGART